MKLPHPNKILYILFGIGAFLVFLLGTAAWHIILDANDLDCFTKNVACYIIPDPSDWYIHLISYILMAPLMIALFRWFKAWRRQQVHLNLLTRNLANLAIQDFKLEEVACRLGLKDKVNLLDSNDRICFCACFTSPKIYISRAVVEALKADELEALLLHEKYHLKNYDPLKILTGRLTVAALFFIPILKDLFKRYLVRKEIAADQFTISFQGHRRGIIGALQKLVQNQEFLDGADFAVSGTEALKYRIDYMMGHKNVEKIALSHIFFSFIIPALSIGSIVVSLTILHV